MDQRAGRTLPEQQESGAHHRPPDEHGVRSPRTRAAEPDQLGERRVRIVKEGTTAYLKLGFRCPAVGHPDFFPMVILDAVLTGAKGLNLWSCFRTAPPQRSARLYRALVERRLASSVSAAALPTEHPFLYLISATAMAGISLGDLESAAIAELERVATEGISWPELIKVKNQLRARLVFENDSVTTIAHQLGFFETVASVDLYRNLSPLIAAVTEDDVGRVAAQYLRPNARTVGWFDPSAPGRPGNQGPGPPHVEAATPRASGPVSAASSRVLGAASGVRWRR